MTWRSTCCASRIFSLIIVFAPLLAESRRYKVERWSQPVSATGTTTTTLPFLVIRGGNNGEESSGNSNDNDPVDNYCTVVSPTLTLADNDSSPSPTIVEAVVVADEDDASSSSSGPDVVESNVSDLGTIEAAGGGVKPHIKSNAVGDPDGEGDSSDDENEEDFLMTDWDESLESNMETTPTPPLDDSSVVLERVQVEVEYTVEDENDEAEELEPEPAPITPKQQRNSAGGVGVRLGQRFGRHKKGGQHNETKSLKVQASKMERHLLEAWQPYIFVPPPVEFETYLKERARSIDSDGRNRLDRRTLYGGLILEWSTVPTTALPSVTVAATPRSSRKFLPVDVSQSLQASLSLATQPVWRKSLQRPSAICLYDASTAEASLRGCTLAMQESVALALVRLSWPHVEIRE
jgi:hypothetical protein